MISKEGFVALNKLLSNMRYFDANIYGERVEHTSNQDNDWNGEVSIYKLKENMFGPDVFIKVVTEEDSYGGDEYVTSIQFVQPKPKEVIVTDFIKID